MICSVLTRCSSASFWHRDEASLSGYLLLSAQRGLHRFNRECEGPNGFSFESSLIMS